MKILVVGAAGKIGRAVVAELGQRHEIVRAGRSAGDVRLDFSGRASLAAGLERVGRIDAVVSTAGDLAFAPLQALTEADFEVGLRGKLMGQVQLAVQAIPYLADGGSITLTSGVLTDEPIAQGSIATMVNAGIEGFVRAAAIELPRGIRINAVSPGLIEESVDEAAGFFPGFEPVSSRRVALAFSRSIEGHRTGQVYKVV